MTDKVYHSFGRKYRSRAAATAIQYAGGSDGWVVPSTERLMPDPEGDLATGSLNAFAESHSASSFDVTIDTGEALVGGAYLARDTTTTVTLSSSTTGQTVYVGWGDSQTDTVIIGKSGAFGSNDERIPIWTFDTDGSGVTAATDERNLDNYRIVNENVEALVNFGESTFSGYPLSSGDIDNININVEGFGTQGTAGTVPTAQSDGSLAMEPGRLWTEDGNSPFTMSSVSSKSFTIADTYDRYFITIQITGSTTTTDTLQLRVNGDTGTNYNFSRQDGASASGNSTINIGVVGGGADHGVDLHCMGRFNGDWGLSNLSMGENSATATHAENTNITSPMSSFTLLTGQGETLSATIRVYGRDIV